MNETSEIARSHTARARAVTSNISSSRITASVNVPCTAKYLTAILDYVCVAHLRRFDDDDDDEDGNNDDNNDNDGDNGNDGDDDNDGDGGGDVTDV